MSTPVINAINNVNQSSLNSLFQSVANNPTATNNLLGSNRNIDAVGNNSQASRGLGNNGGDDNVIRRALCQRTGRDPTNFPSTVTDIINDTTFRGEIFADASLSGLLSGSQPGMAEVASSTTFSNEMVNSATAMSKLSLSQTSMQEIATSQTAMQEVAASSTALSTVAASQTAMQKVAASQTAMDIVAGSKTAMDSVAASPTATSAVSDSSTAVSAIESASTSASGSVPSTSTASVYIAELSGAGGGGGDPAYGQTANDGGNTTLHESVAKGGEGEYGTDRGVTVSSPDRVINEIVGGGSAGGDGDHGNLNGGDGGFLKALVINPDQQTLTLSIGSGGSSVNNGNPGQDGSATIFTPNVY